MYKKIFSVLVPILILFSVSAYPFTQQINFQGRLTSSDATPITTSKNVTFRLYVAPTGGSPIATDGPRSIEPDKNGVFSALLSFDSSYFNGNDRYLEVQVESQPLSPRQQIAAVPYAYRAITAESLIVPGSAQGDILMRDASGWTRLAAGTSGQYLQTQGAGVNPAWSAVAGGVGGSGATGYVSKFTDVTTVGNSAIYESGGNVGIGTTSPAAALDVNGGVRVGNFVTAARPAATAENKGTFIFDTDVGKPYVSNGTVWKPLDSDYDSDGITDAIDVDDNNSSDATAVASDTLSSKTFYSGGQSRTGTMATQTLNATNNTVNAGYYAATTLSAVDSDLDAGNIKKDTVIFGITGTLPAYGIPKTGQTTVYRTGDDGDYRKGTPTSGARFTSSTIGGDAVVTDNATGLMWVADGNSAGCNNGATISWFNAIDLAYNLTFAGYSDWRLPNRFELESILNLARSRPTTDPTFFVNTQWDYYWSSTTFIDITTRAWRVDFLDGHLDADSKNFPFYMRSVRGGQ